MSRREACEDFVGRFGRHHDPVLHDLGAILELVGDSSAKRSVSRAAKVPGIVFGKGGREQDVAESMQPFGLHPPAFWEPYYLELVWNGFAS